MQKRRNRSFDVVRALACLMVMLMHSPMPDADVSGLVLSSISLICAPCIGLFFMVSGTLLLPVQADSRTFLRRWLGKVVAPTLFWTFFYLHVSRLSGEAEWGGLWRSVCSIPFSPQGHGVLWFMYVLVGLYLVAPVLSPWLRQAPKGKLRFFLSLWVVTLLYPVLSLFVTVSDGPVGPLYYFAGYAGYFVLGHYLHRHYRRSSPWLLAAGLLLPLACAAACKLGGVEVDFYSVFWYLSAFVAMMCVSWFQAGLQFLRGVELPSRISRWLTDFSNCSFGIYLVHIFIMRNLLWKSSIVLKFGGSNSVNIPAYHAPFLCRCAHSLAPARQGVRGGV